MKKIIISFALIIALLVTASGCGQSAGESSIDESISDTSSSVAGAAYDPAKDTTIGWYDTGLKCPLATVEWENFADENGRPMIRVGDKEIPAPENFGNAYEDGSRFGMFNNKVGEPYENEIYKIEVYKNGVKADPEEYMDENMVYRISDGRDGSVIDYRICFDMTFGGGRNSFSHEMWTAERLFTITPNTGIDTLMYLKNYNEYGMTIEMFKGNEKVTSGVFEEGMTVRVSKNNGVDFWDYRVVIDSEFWSDIN